MENKTSFRFLWWCLMVTLLIPSAWGYDVIRYNGQPTTWNPGTVTMKVQLGTGTVLSDGSTYNSSVQTALQTWNSQLGTLQFANQVASPAAPVDGNHVNEIGFDSTVYGTAFDANVLAVTVFYFSTTPRSDGTYQRTQSDIVFNSAYTWDSYRGALRTAEDIQRVAIHELGHVLGLDHPDEANPPQNIPALMNSHESDLDTLAADDIVGAQSLYGAATAAPIIISQPANVTVLTGQSAQFSISAIGSPSPSYRWQRSLAGSGAWSDLTDGGGISGSGTTSLNIATTLLAMNGDQFRCVASNTSGSATSNAAMLTVSAPTLPAFTSQPTNLTVTAGQTAAFSVVANGNPAPTYKWQRQIAGSVIWSNLYLNNGSDTLSTLTLTATGVGMNGDHFRCIATNSVGSTTSNEAVLTVLGDTSTISAVAAGNRHTLVVKGDGSLLTAGWNAYGQLGDGTIDDRSNLMQVATGVSKVAAGGGISFFIKTDGTLWAMGWNYAGALGDGTTTDRKTPVQIATGVLSVSAGDSHAVFLKSDGTLWGMGVNLYGALGDGTSVERHTPVQIASGVSAAVAGTQHTLFVKTDATLWAVGWNGSGQLGDGTTTDRHTPVQVASGVTAVSAGYAYSLFLKTDGTLWGMGANNRFQLGDGTLTERHSPVVIASDVARVSAGGEHALFVKTDGTLWGMGDNYYGELCTGSTVSTIFPMQVSSDVASVAAGSAFTAFLKTDGSFWTVGYNNFGNLCDGTALPYGTSRTVPLEISGPPQVVSAPVITLQPVGQSVNIPAYPLQGGTVVFRAWATGSTTLSFQWFKNGVAMIGVTGSVCAIGPVTTNDTGSYTVVVSNAAGSVTSNVAVLTIQAEPLFTTHPYGQMVTAGNAVTLTAIATSATALTYQWQKNGLPISGATGSTYAIASAVAGDAGDYTLVATNAAGSTTSNVATLIVQDASSAYTFTTRAGVAGSAGAVDGTGSTARFNSPSGVAADAAGNIFVVDQNNCTIRRIAAGGTTTTVAGLAGNSGSVDGIGSAARFYGSQGLAVDGAGNIYVADGSTIRKITPTGVVTTWAGIAGSYGFVDGTGSAARFMSPQGVAADGTGNVYVIDGSAIRKITPAAVVTTLAGRSNTSGSTDGVGTNALFFGPYGIAADGAGNVYVADTNNRTIRKITPAGVVSTIAGTAGADGSIDGVGTAARFSAPLGVTVDSEGNLYVADFTRIRKITPAGVVSSLAGLGSGSADGKGTAARFYIARGITVDAVGNVYVADSLNDSIRWGALAPPVFTSATTASGTFGQGFTHMIVFSGAFAPYSATGLPAGLRISPGNGLIVGTPTVIGSFPVVLSAINGAGTTNATLTLTIEAGPAPVFTVQPLGQSVTVGGAITFTAAANGTPTPTYQWQKNGVNILGATNASYTIASVVAGDVGNYGVVATNSYASVTSNVATLALGTIPAGFDVTSYLARYPDMAALYGANPYAAWQHYHDVGIYQGEVFDELFRVDEYLSLYPELFALFGSDLGAALDHWLSTGRIEGRLGRIPLEFSAQGYFTRNPDVATAVNSNPILAWGHYWLYGIYEGRAYDNELRVFEYLAINADLTSAFVNDWRTAALHWMRYGRTEGRLGRLPLTFSVATYLSRNPDVAAVWGTDPTTVFLHFWLYGINEARTYDDLFRVDDYLALNPDLAATFGTDRRGAFKHWVRYGQAEGRPAKSP